MSKNIFDKDMVDLLKKKQAEGHERIRKQYGSGVTDENIVQGRVGVLRGFLNGVELFKQPKEKIELYINEINKKIELFPNVGKSITEEEKSQILQKKANFEGLPQKEQTKVLQGLEQKENMEHLKKETPKPPAKVGFSLKSLFRLESKTEAEITLPKRKGPS